jgi:Fic family protein
MYRKRDFLYMISKGCFEIVLTGLKESGIIGYEIGYLCMMLDPKIDLNHELLKLVAEIDEFKGRWEALKTLSPDRLQQLRHVATIESVGSSTRIEGSKLTDRQVETLLSNLTSTSFKTRDEQEVAGYAEAMDLVFEAFNDIPLTENNIRHLHNVLLRHSVKDEWHRGDYKKLPNHVAAYDETCKEIGIVFETTAPFDTPQQMEDLVSWTRKAFDEQALHPLLITSVFIVRFLAIHAFQDGNGRLSRILTTLLLLRSGYAYVPFASLESIVEENKDLYYKALRRTQSSFAQAHPDYEPWVGFFLRCLKKQKAKLEQKITQLKAESDEQLNPLAQQILQLLAERPDIGLGAIAEALSANPNTVKVRLRELVREGWIIQRGKARATVYARLR